MTDFRQSRHKKGRQCGVASTDEGSIEYCYKSRIVISKPVTKVAPWRAPLIYSSLVLTCLFQDDEKMRVGAAAAAGLSEGLFIFEVCCLCDDF